MLMRQRDQIKEHLKVFDKSMPQDSESESAESFILSGNQVATMVAEYTLEVSTDLVFGLEMNDNTDRKPYYSFFEVFGKRATNPIQYWNYVRGKLFGQDARDQKEVIIPIQNDIREAINTIRNNSETCRDSALKTLIESNVLKGDDDDLMIAAIQLQGGGFDTTKTALLWALAYLAENPEIQNRLFAEIDSAELGKIENSPLLGAVIKETLRMRPSLPVGMFRVLKPFSPPNSNERIIPANCDILLPFRFVNQNEKNFSKSKSFCPDRWLPERDESRFPVHNESAFVSFGGGKRVCIGKTLAEMELGFALSHLCRRYFWTFPPGQKFPENFYAFSLFSREFALKFNKR